MRAWVSRCIAAAGLAAAVAAAIPALADQPSLPAGHVVVGKFGDWEARTYTRKDGSKACATDGWPTTQQKDVAGQWLSVVWGRGETTGYVHYAPDPSLEPDDTVSFQAAGSKYDAYVQDGAAYLHDADNLAVLKALAQESPLVVLVRHGGRTMRLGYSASGFADAYRRIGQECSFSVAQVTGAPEKPEQAEEKWDHAHLQSFGSWGSATWRSSLGAVACDAEKRTEGQPNANADVFVTWRSEKDPHGYLVFTPQDTPLVASDRVSADVDGTSFAMFIDEARAFPYSEDDAKLVLALAKGQSLAVEVTPEKGEARRYRYALDGFADAYREIGRLCGFEAAWIDAAPGGPTTTTSAQPAETPTSETPDVGEPPVVAAPILAHDQVSAAMRNEHRFALVIGNGSYGGEYGLSTLNAPDDDAKAMSDELRQLGFQVQTVLDADLHKMNDAVGAFAREIRKGGVGLFYFSGHGMQMQDRNYLFPIGSRMEREEDALTETFPLQNILAVMQNAGNRLNIVLLDACRSNPFTGGARGRSQGLAAVSAPEASEIVVAYAAAAGRNAYEPTGTGLTHGHYTEALLDAMQVPGLEMEYIFRQSRAAVRKRTENEQIPWWSSSAEGSFYFHLP